MAVATFDTLKFANTLKTAGVPPQQAEAQAVAFAEVIQINLKEVVTKDDLKHAVDDVDQRLGYRIDLLAAEMKTFRTELKGEIFLLKWMFGALMTVNVGILVRLFIYRGGL